MEIRIPKELADKITKRATESGFSVSEYVCYVMKQVIDKCEQSSSKCEEEKEANKEAADNTNSNTSNDKKNLSDQEAEEEVRQRLKNLGYLD